MIDSVRQILSDQVGYEDSKKTQHEALSAGMVLDSAEWRLAEQSLRGQLTGLNTILLFDNRGKP